jgi:hypothetical protein
MWDFLESNPSHRTKPVEILKVFESFVFRDVMHVARWKLTDLSEEPFVYIFNAEDYAKQEAAGRALVSTCSLTDFLFGQFFNPEDWDMFHRNFDWLQLTTQYCIHEDRILHNHCCENMKLPVTFLKAVKTNWPLLWSSGQSSWLQTRDPDSIPGTTRFSEK